MDQLEPFLSLPRSIQLDAEKFILFAISKLRSSLLIGDYNEVIKLSLILLERYPNDIKTPTIHSIGAISRARWMAKVICELHIALFSSQYVKLKVISETEAEKHKHLALFIIPYCISNWIECSLAFEASRLELQLYQRLLILTQKTKNMPVAFVELIPAIIKRMKAHLWYLNE